MFFSPLWHFINHQWTSWPRETLLDANLDRHWLEPLMSSFESQAAKAKRIHECHLEVKFIRQAFKSALRKGVIEICSQRPLNLGSKFFHILGQNLLPFSLTTADHSNLLFSDFF